VVLIRIADYFDISVEFLLGRTNNSYFFKAETAKTFLEYIGFSTNRVKNTMIIGGGKATYYLADQLLHMGISFKILSKVDMLSPFHYASLKF